MRDGTNSSPAARILSASPPPLPRHDLGAQDFSTRACGETIEEIALQALEEAKSQQVKTALAAEVIALLMAHLRELEAVLAQYETEDAAMNPKRAALTSKIKEMMESNCLQK